MAGVEISEGTVKRLARSFVLIIVSLLGALWLFGEVNWQHSAEQRDSGEQYSIKQRNSIRRHHSYERDKIKQIEQFLETQGYDPNKQAQK